MRRTPKWFGGLLACCAAAFTLVAAPSATAAGPAAVGYTIVHGDGCALAQVDLTTGALTELGSETANKCVFDLAFTPDGSQLFGVRNDVVPGDGAIPKLVQFDTTTGAVSDIGQVGNFAVSGPGPAEQGNLTFDTAGNAFTYLVPPGPLPAAPACDGSAFCLFEFNASSPGTTTYVNSVPQTFTVYYGLATSCSGTTVSAYHGFGVASATAWAPGGAAAAPTGQTLASVNLTSSGPGTTDIGAVTGGSIDSLDYDTSGTLYAIGHDNPGLPSLQTVDPTTGAMTKVATLTVNGSTSPFGTGALAIAHPCVGALEVTKTVVPPPGTPMVALPTSFTINVNCDDATNVDLTFPYAVGSSAPQTVSGIDGGSTCIVTEKNTQNFDPLTTVTMTPTGADTTGVVIESGTTTTVDITNDFGKVATAIVVTPRFTG